MLAKYRAFSDSFIEHMTIEGGWPPPYKVAETWIRGAGGTYTTLYYTELMRGAGKPLNYPAGVVKMLVQPLPANDDDEKPRLRRARSAIRSFLKKHAIEANIQNLHAILGVVCDEPTAEPTPIKSADAMEQGLNGILRLIKKFLKLNGVQPCDSPEEVNDAVRWLFVDGGRQVAENPELSVPDAIVASEKHIGFSLGDFQKHAIMWWGVNPLIVVLAKGTKRSNGMSIVLPLTPTTYDAITSGNFIPYESNASDIQTESSLLMIVGAAERPHDLGGERADATPSVAVSMFAQTAALSGCISNLDFYDPIRVLSTAGSPKSASRLRTFGFERIGGKLKGTKMPIVERLIEPSKRRPSDYIFRNTFDLFARIIASNFRE